MKIFTKTEIPNTNNAQGGQMVSSTSSYSVNNIAVAVIVALSGLATAMGTYVGNLSISNNNKALLELKEKYFNVLLLERVLGDSIPDERVKTLRFLMATGIIEDPNGKMKILSDSSEVPRLRMQDQESLDRLFNNLTATDDPLVSENGGVNITPKVTNEPTM